MSAAGLGGLYRGIKAGSAPAEKVVSQSSASSHGGAPAGGKASGIDKGGAISDRAGLQEVVADGVLRGGSQQGVGADLKDCNKNFWAAKTQASRNRERGASLQFFAQVQGADRVVIPAEEWDCATEKFRNALVGFVFGFKPYLGRMKGFARAKWGDESVVRVSQLNEGIFLINFTEEDKKMDVLLGGPWTFDNRPLILKEWSEQEDYKCCSVDALPIWIRLPSIKAHVADLKILSRICSLLGRPICTDADGSTYNFARVCVEVFADSELVDNIEYEDPLGNIYNQPVLYEWRPPRCSNCCNFGHLKEHCPKPNLERMIELMKENEIKKAKEKDKREAVADYDDIEMVEETPMEEAMVDEEEDIQNGSLEVGPAVLKEPMKAVANGGDTNLAKVTKEFQPYLSKSALKRAKQKERRVSEAAYSSDDEYVWTEIAKHLDGQSLAMLAVANKWFHRVVMHDIIWKHVCLRELDLKDPGPVRFKWNGVYNSAFGGGSDSFINRQQEKHIDIQIVFLSEPLHPQPRVRK